MNDTKGLPPGWYERYEAWLERSRPLLEAHEGAAAFRDYPWVTYDDSLLTRPERPLGASRLALVTSGGLSLPGQPPFREEDPLGDATFRWIPGPGPLSGWAIHHGHYDPAAATRDYNAVFPLDIVRRLSEEGTIGSTAARHVSCMGYQTDPGPWLEESVPAITAGLKDEGADAVLLVPV